MVTNLIRQFFCLLLVAFLAIGGVLFCSSDSALAQRRTDPLCQIIECPPPPQYVPGWDPSGQPPILENSALIQLLQQLTPKEIQMLQQSDLEEIQILQQRNLKDIQVLQQPNQPLIARQRNLPPRLPEKLIPVPGQQ